MESWTAPKHTCTNLRNKCTHTHCHSFFTLFAVNLWTSSYSMGNICFNYQLSFDLRDLVYLTKLESEVLKRVSSCSKSAWKPFMDLCTFTQIVLSCTGMQRLCRLNLIAHDFEFLCATCHSLRHSWIVQGADRRCLDLFLKEVLLSHSCQGARRPDSSRRVCSNSTQRFPDVPG